MTGTVTDSAESALTAMRQWLLPRRARLMKSS